MFDADAPDGIQHSRGGFRIEGHRFFAQYVAAGRCGSDGDFHVRCGGCRDRNDVRMEFADGVTPGEGCGYPEARCEIVSGGGAPSADRYHLYSGRAQGDCVPFSGPSGTDNDGPKLHVMSLLVMGASKCVNEGDQIVAAGRMFWFTRKRLAGSYFLLISLSRP